MPPGEIYPILGKSAEGKEGGAFMRAAHALRLPGRPLVWLALLLCALSCAYSLYRLETLPRDERAGTLTGVVAEADISSERYLLRDVRFSGREGTEALPGNVWFTAETVYPYPLEAGSRVRAEVRLLPLQAPANPGAWDERTRLFTDGVVYNAEGEILSHEDARWPDLFARARTRLAAEIQEMLPGYEEEAQVLAALLFGADDALDEETEEAFRRSGTAHLLAVSGLHVGFVMGALALCLRWMRKNSWPQMLCMFAMLGLYAGLVESAFSVWRAVILLAINLLAGHFGRRTDGLSALAAAVILTLLLRPMEVMRAGFQMSAGAVLGILLLSPRLEALLRNVLPVKFLRESVVVTTCAQLGVLPTEVFVFHTLPTLSLLTNLLAVPLSAAITVLGLPALLLHLIHPALAAVPVFALRLLLQVLLLCCRAVADLPFAQVSLASPPILCLLCFLGLLSLASRHMEELRPLARRAVTGAVLLATAASLLLWLPTALRQKEPEILFLSVGTADSALLLSEEGNALLDTGWSGSQAVRALQAEGASLEAVIVTHADADHAGGLAHVLESVPVKTLYLPLGLSHDALGEALDLAQARGVEVRTLRRGDELQLGAFSLTVFWPEVMRGGEENADSLVLRVEAGGGSALFAADITAETEARLGLPRSDILKVAHHGSGTGTTARMLSQVRPQHAVLSLGTPNRYGFPDSGVLSRLEAAGAKVWRTDEDGAVSAVFGETGVTVAPYQPPSLREQWLGLS